MSQKVLSFDLGGTKIAAGVVNSRGRILNEIRVPALFKKGKEAVLQQMVDFGKQLLLEHPEVNRAGIASAGPLDPKRGELLDPTNFTSGSTRWGTVPITKILKKKLKIPVFLENDAAASVLAENWMGAAKNYRNVMVLTLGTGLGTGIICNGELVRSGRNLHPEAGHLILRWGDASAPCGCGNLGCAEAYLSGKNFANRISPTLGKDPISAKEIADLARSGNLKAQNAFAEYAEIMAVAIHNYARIYSPEMIVFTGSFADTFDLFAENTQKHIERFLKNTPDLIPKLAVSSLQNEAGLIGGAYVAFHR